ncbi:MAG: PQQ-binding-like beta-propeller repeat protein [Candidatus Korobacteraceae bacterium]
MRLLQLLTVTLVLSISAGNMLAQQPAAPPPEFFPQVSEGLGNAYFQYNCGTCHGRIEQAPTPDMLKRLTPEKIYATITSGTMAAQAAKLTDEQKVAIAEWLGGRKLGTAESGEARSMSNACTTHPAVPDPAKATSWNGWSADIHNARFQSAQSAGLSPAAVARLELKWTFGLPLTSSAYGQPTVVGDRVFIGSDSGYLYSLNARTGCVYWSFQAQAGLRSTPMIGPAKPGSTQMAAFFGDIRGNVYSVDAASGELLWKVAIDPHPLARVTAGVKVHEGRVYVSVAGLEEVDSSGYDYPCCTSRGIVAALDAATGKQIWKTYTIDETPSKQKNSKGVEFLGPSGASVWGPVTLDPKRRAVYFSTGNAFSAPDVGRANAVMAVNMDTGKILWSQQALHGDVWHTGNCPAGPPPAGFPPRSAGRRPNAAPRPAPVPRSNTSQARRPPPPPDYYCPDEKNNPDWDFSAGVILYDLPNGKSLVVAGQKSGVVWAHDPDEKGKLVWKADISRGSILFGAAADDEYGYFAMRGGALAAVRLNDGVEKWNIYIDSPPAMQNHRGISAAASVIPGVVFTAGLDGMLRAFATFDGRPLWEYDTTQQVTTVNGVKASGGSIGSAGATIVNGMVFVTSGYTGFQRGQPGNLLLAFGPPEQ